MSIITGTPLCWTEEGQKIIEKKGLELQNWLDTEGYKSKESFYLLDMEYAKYPKIVSWWNTDNFQDTYREFISNRENHYVNGEKWNNGQFGSRWADITIEGVRVRLGFYSRQFDPKIFENTEIQDKNLKIMKLNYLIVVSVLDYQEELFMTREEEEEERLIKIQHEKNQEEETKRLEEAKTKADEAEAKLLAEEKAKKDAEEIKKSLPKKKKEKKVKEAKVAVNPHKKEIRVSEGIWKPNPAWKKWEQENKRSASPP